MTDEAIIARANASHCEGIKYALRQSKDGLVVSFVLHPAEIPPAVQLAPIGSRFVLAFVEVDTDEKPKEVMPNTNHKSVVTQHKASPASVPPVPARAYRPVAAEKRLAQQAGICCGDPVFQTFLYEHDMAVEKSEECATTAVRMICSVKSRSEIVPGTPAGEEWNVLYSKFIAWKLVA